MSKALAKQVGGWVALLSALALSGWALAKVTKPRPVSWPKALQGSHFTLENPRLREAGPRGVRFESRARVAHFDKSSNVAEAEGLYGVLLHERGRTELHAAQGRYSLETGRAELSGGIEIHSADGYRLSTTSAVYEQAAGTLYAAGRFQAVGHNVVLYGRGLRYDLQAGVFSIDHDVGANITGFRF